MLSVTECGVDVTSDAFLELYADTAATPESWILREAAELTLDDGR
jgi:hypothetical protein